MSTKLNLLLDGIFFDDNNNPNVIVQYPQLPVAKFNVRNYNLCCTFVEQLPFTVLPNSSLTVFDRSESTNLNNTAQFSITSSGSQYTVYQSAGTNANFRTLRAINLGSDSAFNIGINNSSLVTYTLSAGTSLTTSSIVAGDILYVAAGSPFAAGNQGSFSVISSTTNSISVQNTNAVAQSSVTLGASYASNFKVFSAAGVQLLDSVSVSGGFSPATQGTYVVNGITDNSFSFASTLPLPIETGVTPGASGFVFYSDPPFYFAGNGNNPAALLFDAETNGATVQPITEGYSTLNWTYLKTGNNYKLILKNLSAVNTLSGSFFLAQRK